MSYWDNLKSVTAKVGSGSAKAVVGTTRAIVSFSKKPENDGVVSTIAGAVTGAAIVGTVVVAGSSGVLLGLGLIGGMVLQKMQKQVPPVANVAPVATNVAPVATNVAPVVILPVADPVVPPVAAAPVAGANPANAKTRAQARARAKAQAQAGAQP